MQLTAQLHPNASNHDSYCQVGNAVYEVVFKAVYPASHNAKGFTEGWSCNWVEQKDDINGHELAIRQALEQHFYFTHGKGYVINETDYDVTRSTRHSEWPRQVVKASNDEARARELAAEVLGW